MKKIIMLLVVGSLTFSCSPIKKILNIQAEQEKISVTANDGLSYEEAIVITEKNEQKGLNAAYKWLRENYPDYKLNEEAISFYENKPYDIMSITTKGGEQKKVYFDITYLFGNLLY